MCVFSSTENGEKAEKPEPEPEVKEEEPEETEEIKVKTKAKKEKKPAVEGFELWNELEVQRIKFMVSIPPLQHIFKLAVMWTYILAFIPGKGHCKKYYGKHMHLHKST